MTDNILKIIHDGNVIQMKGEAEFTIAHADAVQSALRESCGRSGDETLNLHNVKALDICGIQLALAWQRCLRAQERKGVIQLPEDENIRDLITKTGITKLFQ
jgi:hypothetical protein